ncbi:secretion system protein E, partial [Burkholderia latens]
MSSSPTSPGKTPHSVTPLILSRAVKPIETDPPVTQGQPAAPAEPAPAPVARPRAPVLSAVAAAAAASVQPAQTASPGQ